MNFFSDETRNAFNHNRGQKKDIDIVVDVDAIYV